MPAGSARSGTRLTCWRVAAVGCYLPAALNHRRTHRGSRAQALGAAYHYLLARRDPLTHFDEPGSANT